MTQIIGTSIQLFRLSSSLTTSILLTMPLVYLAMNVYGSILRKMSRRARLAESEASGIAGEVNTQRLIFRFWGTFEQCVHFLPKKENMKDIWHQYKKRISSKSNWASISAFFK